LLKKNQKLAVCKLKQSSAKQSTDVTKSKHML